MTVCPPPLIKPCGRFSRTRLSEYPSSVCLYESLAARLRTAGAMDLWMGVLGRTFTIGRHVRDYREAADATGDPWFAALAAFAFP